jgi:hypothetical protein
VLISVILEQASFTKKARQEDFSHFVSALRIFDCFSLLYPTMIRGRLAFKMTLIYLCP